MLLIDQVSLLRDNLKHLRRQRISLPLMGGESSTRDAYHFIHLIHPARDIMTTVKKADPGADKLPVRLRRWKLEVESERRQKESVHLVCILGMIIHAYYLRVDDLVLDVSNDAGRRLIVPRGPFFCALKRLLLSSDEIQLVICHLAKSHLEEHIKPTNSNSRDYPIDRIPGVGDFERLLWHIASWPSLLETIWERFFEPHSVEVDPETNTIDDNRPHANQKWIRNGKVEWHLVWRRNGVIARVYVDIIEVIDMVLDHRQRSLSRQQSRS